MRYRLIAAMAVAALLVVACTRTSETTTSTTPGTTSAPTSTSSTTTTTLWEAPEGEIRVGVEYRSVLNPVLAEVSDPPGGQYGVPDQGSLYRLMPPTSTVVPNLALAPEPPLGELIDGGWVVEVPIRGGITWSDGSPFTARDVAFSWELFRESAHPVWGDSNLEAVEAVDALAVQLRWSERPTVWEWQLGVGLAPVVQEAFWSEVADPLDPELDPSSIPTLGPFRVVDTTADGWSLEANPLWWEAGSRYTVSGDGAVEYSNPTLRIDEEWGEPRGDPLATWQAGPHVSRVMFRVFAGQGLVEDALRAMEVDLHLDPDGLEARLRGLILREEDLDVNVVGNPGGPSVWLLFNTRSFPGDQASFRRSVSCLIDKEFMANNILQGTVIPIDSVASMAIAGPAFLPCGPGTDVDEGSRLRAAVQTLDNAGWTWTTEPVWNAEERNPVPVGDGLMLDGEIPEELVILSVDPATDPRQATYALFIEDWMKDLGWDARIDLVLGDEFARRLLDNRTWDLALTVQEHRRPLVLAELAELAGWELDESVAFVLDEAVADFRARERELVIHNSAHPLYTTPIQEAFHRDLDPHPFSSFSGGMQAWEDWLLAAIKPAGDS